MARITASAAGGKNVCAFLDMLAWSEGTRTSRYTRDDGYDVVVGGIDSPNTFGNYAGHPNILVKVNRQGLQSTAAGRYQLLFRWWKPYRALLQLKDFSPESQDRVAIQQIRERRALGDIQEGRVREAITKCASIWASLPGNSYQQRQHSLADLEKAYFNAGGSFS